MMHLKRVINVVLITVAVAAVAFHFIKPNQSTGLLGQENAVWSESIFFRGHNPSTMEPLTDEYIRQYAEKLKQQHITYAYIFGGPFDKDGHLPNYVFSDTAKSSIQKLHEYYPQLKVLPWIGGIENETVYLGDSVWRSNATADCKKLMERLGVPGLHLDFEYFVPGLEASDTTVTPADPKDMAAYPGYVNYFHKQLRDTLPHAYISSVVTSTCPQSTHWKRKTSLPELAGLIPYINQLNFLFYDTMINDTATYRIAAEQQMKDILWLKNRHDIDMLVSVATFVNPVKFQRYHDQKVENLPNALETIKRAAINASPNKKLISGISIFCTWETSRNEWQDIYEHYTKHAK